MYQSLALPAPRNKNSENKCASTKYHRIKDNEREREREREREGERERERESGRERQRTTRTERGLRPLGFAGKLYGGRVAASVLPAVVVVRTCRVRVRGMSVSRGGEQEREREGEEALDLYAK